MAVAPRVLIAGGYGVFGRRLTEELLSHTAAQLIIAGRNAERAAAACRRPGLGDRLVPIGLDLDDLEAVRRATSGCVAVVCVAGPFQMLNRALPGVVVRSASHWLDLADDPAWVSGVLGDLRLDSDARRANLVAISGLSTVPALSGALARTARERLADASRARVTLYIGNRNPKGAGAIASSLAGGMADPVRIDLPIGRPRAYRAVSPDQILLKSLGLTVEFRVAFQSPVAGPILGLLGPLASRLHPRLRRLVARSLAACSAPTSRLGSSLGSLQVELWNDSAQSVTVSLTGRGQRLAILPSALALEAILSGDLPERGVLDPTTWLRTDQWIARLAGRGVSLAKGFTSNTAPPIM